jgi:hypothetical protein
VSARKILTKRVTGIPSCVLCVPVRLLSLKQAGQLRGAGRLRNVAPRGKLPGTQALLASFEEGAGCWTKLVILGFSGFLTPHLLSPTTMFKTTVVLAAVAAATVSGYATYPAFCPQSELAKLAPLALLNSDDIKACQSASGWTLIPPSAEPTVAQETTMCSTQSCKNLVAAVQKLNPADCFLSLSNNQQGINAKKLVEEFAPFCALLG